MLLATGLGALPVLGTGLLLLVPGLLAMQAAVRIERRRAVAVHGISVIVPARRRSRRTGFPGWLHDLWLEVSSAAFWKGVLHHHLAMLVAGVFFLGSLTLLWASWTDRKSTRLNSSHVAISYAVFCLKKKNILR